MARPPSNDTKSEVDAFGHLLIELHDLLVEKGERNWIRGIDGVIALAKSGDFDGAKSSYWAMTRDGRGFSEYHIWIEDDEQRISANARLTEVRELLWKHVCWRLL